LCGQKVTIADRESFSAAGQSELHLQGSWHCFSQRVASGHLRVDDGMTVRRPAPKWLENPTQRQRETLLQESRNYQNRMPFSPPAQSASTLRERVSGVEAKLDSQGAESHYKKKSWGEGGPDADLVKAAQAILEQLKSQGGGAQSSILLPGKISPKPQGAAERV